MLENIKFRYLFYERTINVWIDKIRIFQKINNKTFKIKIRCKMWDIVNSD